MNEIRMEQIALAIVSYQKALKNPEIPDLIDQTQALKYIRDGLRRKIGFYDVVVGKDIDLVKMAETLGLPKDEYTEFCQRLAHELTYLHIPGGEQSELNEKAWEELRKMGKKGPPDIGGGYY